MSSFFLNVDINRNLKIDWFSTLLTFLISALGLNTKVLRKINKSNMVLLHVLIINHSVSQCLKSILSFVSLFFIAAWEAQGGIRPLRHRCCATTRAPSKVALSSSSTTVFARTAHRAPPRPWRSSCWARRAASERRGAPSHWRTTLYASRWQTATWFGALTCWPFLDRQIQTG